MSSDVYSPCPCGSGKKLKFCCQALAGEMDKAQKFFENKQYRNALQTLESLRTAHPDNSWVMTVEASIYLETGEMAEANRILKTLIDTHPDHLLGIGLFALTSLAVHRDDLEISRPAVCRAFQRCPRAYPGLVFSLASSLARLMTVRQCWMACRAHLALALRFAPDKDRQEVFYEMLELDGADSIPYPFRGAHHLAAWRGDEETTQQAAKGQRLSALGCWGPAARLYSRLAEDHPDDPVLWQNAGLCRAWDGEERQAATALHRAAELHTDFETAVELETLAQLLDRNNADDDDQIEMMAIRFRVPSPSQLLTRLDDQQRFTRQLIPPPDEENEAEEPRTIAMFAILDRVPDDAAIGDEVRPEDLPLIIARFTVFEGRDEERPTAVVTGWKGDNLDEAVRLLTAAAGDQVERFETDDAMTVFQDVKEVAGRGLDWYFPDEIPFALRRQLLHERWVDLVSNQWPNRSLMGLRGQTPREAAGDDALRIPLAAAVSVLDADGVVEKTHLDLSDLYEQLSLPAPEPIAIDEQAPLNALSVMQLLRLPISPLSDSQLKDVFRRAMLIHHPQLLDEVLREAASRPAFLEDLGPEAVKVYQTLATLARDRGQHADAVEWTRKQIEFVKASDDTFQTALLCRLQELTLRLEAPSDPELKPLIHDLSQNYAPKVPALRKHLRQLLDSHGIPAEWLSDIPAMVASEFAGGTAGEQGIWTPDESGSSSGEPEKKLWLPGSE